MGKYKMGKQRFHPFIRIFFKSVILDAKTLEIREAGKINGALDEGDEFTEN